MTSDSTLLCSIKPVKSLHLQVANSSHIPVVGLGSLHSSQLNLSIVLHVPQLSPNLASVGQLIDENCSVLFAPYGYFVQDLTTGRLIGRGVNKDKLLHWRSCRVNHLRLFLSLLVFRCLVSLVLYLFRLFFY
ncbi:unnamed protein product [Linum trigynum]|uniref:Retrovirus-related Pol polyprotein from transposon TNT 1-94-like beta-barrel domain-containing protein n=1 Tax=Linum trigynum TaxID=586398 RepID=A0AAV2DTD1_9ROSI